MLNIKVILLAFLLLATNALAAVRVTYSAKFTGQKVGDRTQKLASVEEDEANQIVEHMATWSNNKYTASQSRSVANMIIVVNAVAAASKGEASEMVQEMQSIVNRNLRPAARTPSPHRLRMRSAGQAPFY